VLRVRLVEIERARLYELAAIAANLKQVKSEVKCEMEAEQSEDRQPQEPIESALHRTAIALANLQQEMKRYKKIGVFLRRRCLELRRDNRRLQQDLNETAQLEVKTGCDMTKLQRQILARTTAVNHHRCQVEKYESDFEHAEKQWQSMKTTNKMIRGCINKMIWVATASESRQVAISGWLVSATESYTLASKVQCRHEYKKMSHTRENDQ